jgi:YbbR domain-containing protein
VRGVTIRPAQVRTTIVVERRPNTRIAGVQVATRGTLPEGYRLSRIRVTPSELTLLGDPAQLAAVGSAVGTLPIDLSQLVGDFVADVPLELPAGVHALTSSGEGQPGRTVTVLVELGVVARRGSLRLSPPIEILGDFDGTVTVKPTQVELLLSGPVPTLNEIQADPRLVRVFVDLADLGEAGSGKGVLVALSVIKPDGVTVQSAPTLVTLTIND